MGFHSNQARFPLKLIIKLKVACDLYMNQKPGSIQLHWLDSNYFAQLPLEKNIFIFSTLNFATR